MATYAIGDIQGCFDELQALLKLINYTETDQLWFAGDLINRGPKSLETLRFIKGLGDKATVVLGNHDLHLLAVHYTDARLKRQDTLTETLAADDCDELMLWLKSQPLVHFDNQLNALMSHAGIPANWSIEQTLARAAEVSKALQGENYQHFFEKMYGNQPDQWHDTLSGMDRLRCITNYLTRMRFCEQDHQLNLSFKGELGSQPETLFPWFDLHSVDRAKPVILFGHWAALMGKTKRDDIIALDTGCVWGEEMTAYCIETQQRYSVSSIQ